MLIASQCFDLESTGMRKTQVEAKWPPKEEKGKARAMERTNVSIREQWGLQAPLGAAELYREGSYCWRCLSPTSRWVPSVVYSIHVDSARYTAVAIAQSSNGSFLNYNDDCSGCSDKRQCEEFRVLLQLARTKLGARSIWRHLAHSASSR